jgi:hypothetical protein
MLGGATLGLAAAAVGHAAILMPDTLTLVLGGALAAVVLIRLVVGRTPPSTIRQVDHRWLDKYRGFVVGGGFGYQLGTGVLTRMWSYAVYLLLALSIMGAPWWAVAAGGTAYGLARGVSAAPGGLIRTVRDLAQITYTLERWDGWTARGSRVIDFTAAAAATLIAIGGVL